MHYARLLGVADFRQVSFVCLRFGERRVEMLLEHIGSGVSCPKCGPCCGLPDRAEEQHAGGTRILDEAPERAQVAAEAGLQTLTVEQHQEVQAVAADVLPAYANAVGNQIPNPERGHDEVHVVKH